MANLFMLLGELGFSDQSIAKSFWAIGIIASAIVLLVRRQQILPALNHFFQKCHEPKIRGCLIFAPCCAICGVVVYLVVMPLSLSEANKAKLLKEPSSDAHNWILFYLIFYGSLGLAPIMTLWDNIPKIAFIPNYLLPLLIYMSIPPLGLYSMLILAATADVRSVWFVLMPFFQWLLCLVPLSFLRQQNVIRV